VRVSDEFGVPDGGRTWRAPLSYRVSLIAAQAVPVAAAAAFSWHTLSSNQLPGQVVLAVAVPLWASLAFRAWTASATLARDTLVVRNVLSTDRVPIVEITKVAISSSRGRTLKVTERRPPPTIAAGDAAFPRHHDPGVRHTVTAIQVGVMASVSGARCEADDAADLIAAAAGLPALPARRAQVTREMSLVMIPAGIALFAFGVTVSAMGRMSGDSVGGALKGLGAAMFLLAVMAELGRFIQRRRT
jgi:hypothetical protein